MKNLVLLVTLAVVAVQLTLAAPAPDNVKSVKDTTPPPVKDTTPPPVKDTTPPPHADVKAEEGAKQATPWFGHGSEAGPAEKAQ